MSMLEKLGEYKILKKINSGGNGTVYLAEDKGGQEVAIKVLKDGDGKRYQKKRKRFIFETKKVVEIQDEIPGIIPIFAYALPDKIEKKYWYAMPIAVPIKDKVKEFHDMEIKVECILELAKILVLLHHKGIVHRDIKPQNIYYYDGRYCFGDFGLVDYPERNEVTSLQEPIGPRATMAPEMRYNSKNADGKKADVYSLAKTLWILLKEVEYGFEGRYEEDDSIIGLRSDKRYKSKHLVELDALLKRATEYEPELRPDISEFVRLLEEWLEITNNYKKRNFSEWRYIQNKLFPGTIPMHTEWSNVDSIILILNYIGSMPGLNHVFIPTGGGQDIESAERAVEPGCICLVAGGCHYVLKPKKLELENFGVDYIWSYFRLELHNLQPVSDFLLEGCRELLIEDYPGHYVTSNLMDYERYDDGIEFPKGYRQIDRFVKGTFVAFSKQSVYNHISGTYDARHNKMNSHNFKNYIWSMRKAYYESNKFQDFLDIYEKNPFKIENEIEEAETHRRIKESIRFDEFVKQNWKKWSFKSICDRNKKNAGSKLEFAIYFHINGGSFSPDKYIAEDGEIHEEKSMLYPISKEGKYLFQSYEGAVNTITEIIEYIKEICNSTGIVWTDMGIYFTIELFRVKPPIHLFNKEEIKIVLKEGNDFRNNSLVIDENGYAILVDSDLPYEKYQYPVVYESYDARKNNVGQYSSLARLDEIYTSMLDGWLLHLRTGKSNCIDYYERDIDEEQLIKAVKEFY